MKVALTGGSGFVASYLKKAFPNYIDINRNDNEEKIIQKLKDIDVVFNLAGASILHKWSDNYKKILYSSRIETTKKLVKAINKSNIKHFISTSAIGIYPDNTKCDENCNNYNNDFLATLVKKWENEAKKCIFPTTIIRFGVVIGKNGGALKEMLLPFKLGLGGIIGNGQMIMSWIDIDDLVRIYKFILEKKLTGIINATSPHPVTNKEFTKTFGKILHRPTIFKIPEFFIYLKYKEGAKVLTSSKEVYPKRLLENKFEFKYPTIQSSLEKEFNNDLNFQNN